MFSPNLLTSPTCRTCFCPSLEPPCPWVSVGSWVFITHDLEWSGCFQRRLMTCNNITTQPLDKTKLNDYIPSPCGRFLAKEFSHLTLNFQSRLVAFSMNNFTEAWRTSILSIQFASISTALNLRLSGLVHCITFFRSSRVTGNVLKHKQVQQPRGQTARSRKKYILQVKLCKHL